jgi:hypothetical protein
MYFVYNGSVDVARPRIFGSAREADDAWDDLQKDPALYGGGDPLVDEPVEVMPYFGYDDTRVRWTSTANRESKRITGPLSDWDE